MATFVDVKARAEKSTAFLAQLIADPKKALSDAKLELSDPADIKRVELFTKVAQEHVRAAAKVVGVKAATADWGIGASCCNGKLLMPGGLKPTRDNS